MRPGLIQPWRSFITPDTPSGIGHLEKFSNHLIASGKGPHTIDAYSRDVKLFSEWFIQTNGHELTPERITPIDVREYRGHMLTVENYKPTTVNRKLSSISAFCEWAREAGLMSANPADGISQVDEVRPAPKWLDRNEQYALLRAVQEKGRKRDIALITLILNTGLRVSEISNLKVDDLKISPRKGSVTVRVGKGEKHRLVLLNVDTRRAIQDYQKREPFRGRRSPLREPAGRPTSAVQDEIQQVLHAGGFVGDGGISYAGTGIGLASFGLGSGSLRSLLQAFIVLAIYQHGHRMAVSRDVDLFFLIPKIIKNPACLAPQVTGRHDSHGRV